MRYALRNQQKINSALGSDFLEKLLKSCDWHFANCEIKKEGSIKEIWQHGVKHFDTAFDTIRVKSRFDDTTFVLYIIKEKYDVYTLAFKEFIG